VWLAQEPGASAAIGRNAAAHIARWHTPEKIGAAYRKQIGSDRSDTLNPI
jgi:hypothetical protein